jgi:hypothetical protein
MDEIADIFIDLDRFLLTLNLLCFYIDSPSTF